MDIANSIVAQVDTLIPGKPPFGVRPLTLVLDDPRKWGPLVYWDEQAHHASSYQIFLRSVGSRWTKFLVQRCNKLYRYCRLDPYRPIYSWRALAFELGHELAHIKMGPARSNLVLEVMATAVSLETLSHLQKAWHDYPPTSWPGWPRYAACLSEYRQEIVRSGSRELPPSIRQGFWDQPLEEQEIMLGQTRDEVAGIPLWGGKSRNWQMAAAELLLRRALTRKERWRDLCGLAMRTQPLALNEPGYRDDLPLLEDALPWWLPEWLR
ncbi:hypothetical protein DTL42_03415 [Bremerella cremea]|uniref:Uncharacterized protein n=2 Tax=Bremerella cremea TaxID=1031537 RepID=A0A368KUW2_9BACT|nr:hypothetical protein DTL42_03415 [Bremerella cremea]